MCSRHCFGQQWSCGSALVTGYQLEQRWSKVGPIGPHTEQLRQSWKRRQRWYLSLNYTLVNVKKVSLLLKLTTFFYLSILYDHTYRLMHCFEFILKMYVYWDCDVSKFLFVFWMSTILNRLSSGIQNTSMCFIRVNKKILKCWYDGINVSCSLQSDSKEIR